MLQNPWRAWLEPDAVDESADAQTTHDSAVVDAPPAQLHDIVEYTSQAGQRRNLVRVSGPFDAGVAPSVALEAAGRLLRVSLAAAALLADQVDAVDQAFVLHTGHDRPRRDALVALAARENSGDWSYSLALPAAADGESLTSCLVACPVRGSAVSQRLLFVDVGVLVSRDAEDDVESSPIEPQSPPPE